MNAHPTRTLRVRVVREGRNALGFQLWGRTLHRDESRILQGYQESREYDVTGRLTWTPTDDQEVMLQTGRARIERQATPGWSLEPDQDRDRQENTRDHWLLSHLGQWEGFTSELSFTREQGQRSTWSVTDGALVRDERAPRITNGTRDAKLTAPLTLAGQHTLVGGMQWQRSELDDINPGLDDQQRMTFSAEQWALYAEDQWEVSPDLSVTLGGRWTDHAYFGAEFRPRIYAVWRADDAWTIKGGISTGYSTPDLRQIVPGYFYTTQRGAGVIVSNPDLRPESSTSFELGAVWQRAASQFSVTAFQTDFRDKIESYNTGETVDVAGRDYNRWEYINVQDARIRGVELAATTDLSANLSLRATYTHTDSEQLSGRYEGLPLTRTPRHMASLRLDWRPPVEGRESWALVNYHGAEVNAGARIGTNGQPEAYDEDGNPIAYRYDAFTTVDMGASYRLTDRVTVDAAIYNLLDEKVTAAEHNTYQEGRRLWLGLSSTF